MAKKDYASWSRGEVERFLKLSTPDRTGAYLKTAEEVAKALGRSRYAIQSMRRKFVKAAKLAGKSHATLVKLLLVGEHRLAKLRTSKVPERTRVGGYQRKAGKAAPQKTKKPSSTAVHGYSRKRPAARKGRA